jgi:hypothetical protein
VLNTPSRLGNLDARRAAAQETFKLRDHSQSARLFSGRSNPRDIHLAINMARIPVFILFPYVVGANASLGASPQVALGHTLPVSREMADRNFSEVRISN